MKYLEEIVSNPILVCPVVGFISAQILKVIIYTIVNKCWNWERVMGGGGMPSSHSATVGAMCTATFLMFGPSSFEFAMSFIFAFIVMYDAMNVRLETGRQGAVLNMMLKSEEIKEKLDQTSRDKWGEIILKEYVGHTPLQVTVGLILGIGIGIGVTYLIRGQLG